MGNILCFYGETVNVNGVVYYVDKEIGEGAFSFVQLVSPKKSSDERFALKRVLIQLPEHEDMIQREIKCHEVIINKYIMKLIDHDIVEDGDRKEARLLFPYHQLGSVQEMIEVATITKNPLKEDVILQLFQSLCEAVNAFHTHKPAYAHRDIKPHNMLIGEYDSVILMDLGSAREAIVNITSRQEALAFQELCAQDCTAAYRAPEMFEVPSECVITEKTDIWALGCTLHALAYGDSPCDGSALAAVSPNIKSTDIYTNEFNELIKSQLNIDPEQRPSAQDLLVTIKELLK